MSPLSLSALICLAAALLAVPNSSALPFTPWVAPAGIVRRGRLSPRSRRAVVIAVGLLASDVLLQAWPWWLAVVLAIAAGVASIRIPQRRSHADRAVDRRRLAVHCDLLAACLDAGMSVGAALLAVPGGSDAGPRVEALARPDPVNEDPITLLDAVAALLMLGADPQTAWRSAQQHPDLTSLAAAARRSAAVGAGFADAVREHAVTLRAALADSAERSAGRAGVAMTAPLGLCFLPAFLCLGLAPVIVGLLTSLHLF